MRSKTTKQQRVLLTLDNALDYPGSMGAMWVVVSRYGTLPKQIVLTAPNGKYQFVAVTGTRRSDPPSTDRLVELNPKIGDLLTAKPDYEAAVSLERSELMEREAVVAYARFILHIPNEPVWLALVG